MSAVRLIFQSGAELTLGPNTRAGVLSQNGQTDWVFVRTGTAHISAPKRSQLGIRTRTLVAGVSAAKVTLKISPDESTSQVAVLSGEALVASDTKSFATKERRTRVPSGHFAVSTREGLQRARKLDEKRFLASLKKYNPPFAALVSKRATPYARLSPAARTPAAVLKK